jgi:Flp pilus assembly protein TadG
MKRKFISEDCGSASIEFVALAIPLFLPILIYFSNFAEITDSHSALRTLARESARAFVLSENDRVAYQVASDVLEKGAAVLGYQGRTTLDIQCSQRPCISPDAKIMTTVTAQLKGSRKISVSAIEYVSPWS